jgi:hypothetical protein
MTKKGALGGERQQEQSASAIYLLFLVARSHNMIALVYYSAPRAHHQIIYTYIYAAAAAPSPPPAPHTYVDCALLGEREKGFRLCARDIYPA